MRPGTRRRQPRSPKALLSCRRVVLLLLAVVVAVLDGREVGFALAQQHDDGGADTPVDPIELVRAEAEGGDAAKGGGSSSSADDESAAKIAADAKIKAALGDAGAGAGGGGGDAAGATTDTETKKASGGDAAAAAAAAEIEEDPYANLDFSEMNDLDFDLEPGEDAYADDTGVDGEGMPDGGDDDDRDLEANFHMTEFAPSHVFTFPLGARQEECFFEDILRVPLKLRGAYFVASGASLEVDFAVKRASNTDVNSKTTIYEKRGQTESMFHAMAETPGQYSFCFSNRDSTQDKMVTFALHVGTRKPERAKRVHVTPLENAVRSTSKSLQEMVAEQEFLKLRTRRHIATQDNTEWRVTWYTVFESVFMVGITLGQVFYVQRLVNNRQWV